MCSGTLVKKIGMFTLISPLAVTTLIAIDYSRDDCFLKAIFEPKQVTDSGSETKTSIKLTE